MKSTKLSRYREVFRAPSLFVSISETAVTLSAWRGPQPPYAIRINMIRCSSRRRPVLRRKFITSMSLSRVVVMDFIEARSIRSIPGGSQGLVQALGESLRSLQATRPFQRFIAYPDIVDRLWQWVCQTGLFAPGVLDPYTERLARIRETYIWEPADLVSSHNDPVPLNILFDGDRLWLIDWEIAYRNDPLVDVAIILDNLAPSPELESLLLKTWLGREPEDELRAQLVQVRALTRLFYTGVLFSASAAASGAMADDDLSAMTIAEFRQAIRDGQLQPYSLPTRHVLGKMYLASFLAGTVPPALWPADWQNGS